VCETVHTPPLGKALFWFLSTDEYEEAPMTKAARGSLVVCFFLALYGVIYVYASAVATNKRTVQEADFWKAAGCDELCLQTGPREVDISNLFGP